MNKSYINLCKLFFRNSDIVFPNSFFTKRNGTYSKHTIQLLKLDNANVHRYELHKKTINPKLLNMEPSNESVSVVSLDIISTK